MDLPADQRLLYRDLTAKLEEQEGETQLIRFMGGVLHSLLRRKGDAEFLRAVQDSFATGLSGRSWQDQIALAREVIGLIITKRPEVALAWQSLHGEKPHPLQRRAADQDDLPPPADLDDLPDFSLTPDEDDEPPPPAAPPEELVADYVSGTLERRLALFPSPVLRWPSPVYSHEQPFFLFSPHFSDIARRFLTRVLLGLMRADLARVLYDHMDAALLADEHKLKAFLAERRPDLWAIIMARLGRLSGDLHSAEAKLAAAKAGGHGPEFQTVDVPVTRPRVFNVLGVAFTLGSRTDIKRMKIRVNPSTKPDTDEMLALDVITRLRDMAARVGLDLPAACDFAFLRTLLELDTQRYAKDWAELQSLAADQNARDKVLERLNQLDRVYSADLADVLAITLFHHGTEGAFGFQEFYQLGLEWSATAPRPFLLGEIARRPRDLAFQIRDCLRKRTDRNGMGLAVVMLFEVWRVMDRARFKAEMDAALTVFSAFPVAFAGDADEKAFSEIGSLLFKTLSADPLDAAGAIETVIRLYTPVVERAKR